VRYHSTHADGGALRISACPDWRQFRRQELYSDYYRHIGIDHVVAVPVVASSGLVMSYVLNRRGRDFDDHECGLLDAMRPALANLYRFASWVGAPPEPGPPDDRRLTPREEEVLRFVAAGKSDKQVAAALGASVRTVHKHLENAYAKLGVSNRTAAVMRLEGMRRLRA
jgi:DNA-binding CsgD family transcriptional regulator